MENEETIGLMQLIGEKYIQFGKYEGEKIRDIPESYIIFVTENHKKNKLNEDLKYYGSQLIAKRKKI